MGSYLDLQNRIATDLTRDDLTSQIKSAIQDAIANYEPDRFWFNTSRALTFATVASQVAYGSAALSQIPNIIRIDHLFFTLAGQNVYELERREPADFEYLTSGLQSFGRPTDYTYIDGQILLWPIPNAVFTMRPHMHYRLSTLSTDTDTNAWTTEAERLIRAHAKLELYNGLLEDDEGAARMQLKIPAYKSKLDYETSAHSATGQIRSTDF